jgi:vacuolar-type H+-ATPase subunit B/Vma2
MFYALEVFNGLASYDAYADVYVANRVVAHVRRARVLDKDQRFEVVFYDLGMNKVQTTRFHNQCFIKGAITRHATRLGIL